MSTDSASRIPVLEGFAVLGGIPVSWIGDDGDAVALGHHGGRQTLTAFTELARRDCPGDLRGYYRRTVETMWAALATHCDVYPGCGGPDGCGAVPGRRRERLVPAAGRGQRARRIPGHVVDVVTTIDAIRACSRWGTSAEVPPVVGYSSGSATVEKIDAECPRHGSTECLATYRIEEES